MPIEEIAEGVIRVFARFVAETLGHIVFEVICYGLGFVTLKILSFGRYPKAPLDSRAETICSLVGLAELIALAFFIAFRLCCRQA